MYDVLIPYIQHSRRFDTADLEEAWVIVPISLRITSYSPSSIPAYSDRPTIHVEGEMGGAGWEGNVSLADEDIRRVYGTVSMLADGSVRWSIVSYHIASQAPQRFTETATDIARRR